VVPVVLVSRDMLVVDQPQMAMCGGKAVGEGTADLLLVLFQQAVDRQVGANVDRLHGRAVQPVPLEGIGLAVLE